MNPAGSTDQPTYNGHMSYFILGKLMRPHPKMVVYIESGTKKGLNWELKLFKNALCIMARRDVIWKIGLKNMRFECFCKQGGPLGILVHDV